MSSAMKVMYQACGSHVRRLVHDLAKHPRERVMQEKVGDSDPRIPTEIKLQIMRTPRAKKEKREESGVWVRVGKHVRKAVKRHVPRKGKTAKDHKSGAHASRFANRAARVQWQQDRNARPETFPGGRK